MTRKKSFLVFVCLSMLVPSLSFGWCILGKGSTCETDKSFTESAKEKFQDTSQKVIDKVKGESYKQHHIGFETYLLASPHQNAKRSVFNLQNRTIYYEYYADPMWSIKILNNGLEFDGFSQSGELEHTTWGLMGRGRLPLDNQWIVSGGVGLSNTAIVTRDQDFSGSSSLVELRLSRHLDSHVQIGFSILTIDGSSGNQVTDINLGSTNYGVGFDVGF